MTRLAFLNFVQDGALMFRRKIAKFGLPTPVDLTFEDSWIAFVLLAYNTKIYLTKTPLIYYRIHDHNSHGSIG